MATTELLNDPGHVRNDLKMMETAVSRSMKHPEIPIPQAVIDAMPKIVSNMMLRSEDERIRCRASELLLKFMQYNVSLNPPQAIHGPSQTINVGVNVTASTDDRRNRTLAIAERFGASRVLSDSSGGSSADDSGTDRISGVVREIR